MHSDFSIYITYILIVAFFLICTTALIIARLSKSKSTIQKPQLINGGNVSVFFDRANNVSIIPYAKDKFGVGRAVGSPLFIKWPYNTRKLGECARLAMELCKTQEICSNSELMAILDCSEWADFSKGRRNISVYYKEGHGIVLNSTMRKADGSYQFNHPGLEKVLGVDVSDMELGGALLEMLRRCR